MKPVRWGIIGVSEHFIRRVLLPIQKSSLVELHRICSRSPDRAKSAAEQYGIHGWHPCYEDLINDSSIEAVYIPLPNHLHAQWIKKAADAGKHILCEKPLALNADEARDAIAYAQEKGVLVMEGFMYRFHPQWRRVKELVQCGEIGQIRTIHTVFAYHNTDPANIRNSLEKGGGALMDIGCYAVSAARFLLGQEPKQVISLVQRDNKFGTDILSSGILAFETARSLFTVGTQTFPAQVVDVYASGGRITVHIPFNIYPDVPARVTVTTSVGSRELQLGPADQYGLEFEEFSKAIRNGQCVPIPPEDAINNQKVIDALFRSEKSGNWEKV